MLQKFLNILIRWCWTSASRINKILFGKLLQTSLWILRIGKKFILEISNVPLVPNYVPFTLNFFMIPLPLMIFYSKLIGKILLTVLFVIKFQKLLHTFFVIVILLNLFGRRLFRLLKPNTTLTLICQPLINFWCAPR